MTVLETSPQSPYASEDPAKRQVRTKDFDEAVLEKLRKENRERKKKWREQNEERNKDNDLRCRVNKRASKLFGLEDGEEKQRWIQEEFTKRQQKRKEKERRRMLVFSETSPAPMSSSISVSKSYVPSTVYSYPQQNVLPPMMKSESCNIALPPMTKGEQYNSDFPIDAVLSLMELNGAIHYLPNVASH